MVEQLRELDRMSALHHRNRGLYSEMVDVCLSAALDLVFRRPDERCVKPKLVHKMTEFIMLLTREVLTEALRQRFFLLGALCELLGYALLSPRHESLHADSGHEVAAFVFRAALHDVEVRCHSFLIGVKTLQRQEFTVTFRGRVRHRKHLRRRFHDFVYLKLHEFGNGFAAQLLQQRVRTPDRLFC